MSDPVGIGIEIAEMDPTDDADFAEWYSVYAEADAHGRTIEPDTWSHDEMRAMYLQHSRTEARRGFIGRLGDRAVVVGDLRLPLVDNRHRAELLVDTLPAYQRQGLGGAMLRHLESEAAALGRTTLGNETTWPYAAGPDGTGHPGPEFARRHGYRLALTDVRRQLALPVHDDTLDRLHAETAPHWSTGPAAYTLRSFHRPVPEELLAGWARVEAAVDTEAPVGDLDLDPWTPDTAAVREDEALLARQGRTSYATVALDVSGEVVAYTELVVPKTGRTAYQWGTLVLPEHRGHRLGLAVKVTNLRFLQWDRPDLMTLTTYNAESNAPMVAVNEALGFVPVERLGEFQKRLA